MTETLKNGARVIANYRGIVLAKTRQDTVAPFVTWRIDANGNAYSGHYFSTFGKAATDWVRRTGGQYDD